MCASDATWIREYAEAVTNALKKVNLTGDVKKGSVEFCQLEKFLSLAGVRSAWASSVRDHLAWLGRAAALKLFKDCA
jgi:hypothetical protein